MKHPVECGLCMGVFFQKRGALGKAHAESIQCHFETARATPNISFKLSDAPYRYSTDCYRDVSRSNNHPKPGEMFCKMASCALRPIIPQFHCSNIDDLVKSLAEWICHSTAGRNLFVPARYKCKISHFARNDMKWDFLRDHQYSKDTFFRPNRLSLTCSRGPGFPRHIKIMNIDPLRRRYANEHLKCEEER